MRWGRKAMDLVVRPPDYRTVFGEKMFMSTSALRALSNDFKSSADSRPVRRGISLPLLVAIVGVTAACLAVDANAADDGVPIVRVE